MIGHRISRAVLCLGLLPWAGCHVPAQAPALNFELAYSTYLGGPQFEQAREIIIYPDGSALVGAMVASPGMPTTEGVVQPAYAGDDPALGHGGIYSGDGFLAHLSADGARILAATYFGGSRQERGIYGMAIDVQGNIVISSATRSPDLATTEGAYQTEYGGPEADMYAAKLTPDLKTLLWCTYVGASKTDWPRGGLAVDGEGNVYVVGGTDSPDFPLTAGVFQSDRRGERDAAIVKLSADGSQLLVSTLLGGDGWDGLMGVSVDSEGAIYVAGHTQSTDFPVTAGAPQKGPGGESDCYLSKLLADGSRLIYSTYLGGAANEFAEHRPCLLPDGSVLLTGVTASADFPTTDGAYQRALKGKNDGFLTKLSADGGTLVFSTLLGGSGGEFWLMPTPDESGNIYIVGQTDSRDLPTTPNALQPKFGGGNNDGALVVFSPDGSKLLYCTYLGGSDADMIRSMTLGPAGEVYLVGNTSSSDFPVTANAVQTDYQGKSDAFIVKLVPRQ